jgi:hypothetical protein
MSDSCDKIIFFDLETSSLHKVGQILNYCFVCIDKNWKELDRIYGQIKLSRLELPDPMAIAATGIDVCQLQSSNHPEEYEAITKIYKFIKKWEGPRTGISGYNTEDFDIPFLRTTFVRNGYYPYPKLRSCDLMILTQYIFATNDETRKNYRQFLAEKQKTDNPRYSIKLENISSFFSLLTVPQSHESQDDVNLTIELARLYSEKFNSSIFEFVPYSLFEFQKANGAAVPVITHPRQWDNTTKEEFFCFLRVEGQSAYWTNLDDFAKWKKSKDSKLPIKRFKHCEAIRRPGTTKDIPNEYSTLAKDAFQQLQGFKVPELYPEKNVYIEQWIYRLERHEMYALFDLINNKLDDLSSIESTCPNIKDIKSLYRRFLLANASQDLLSKELSENYFRYINFRYNGGMLLYSEQDPDKPSDRPFEHLTYKQLYSLISSAESKISQDKFSDQKKSALSSLRTYYDESSIKQILTKNTLKS